MFPPPPQPLSRPPGSAHPSALTDRVDKTVSSRCSRMHRCPFSLKFKEISERRERKIHSLMTILWCPVVSDLWPNMDSDKSMQPVLFITAPVETFGSVCSLTGNILERLVFLFQPKKEIFDLKVKHLVSFYFFTPVSDPFPLEKDKSSTISLLIKFYSLVDFPIKKKESLCYTCYMFRRSWKQHGTQSRQAERQRFRDAPAPCCLCNESFISSYNYSTCWVIFSRYTISFSDLCFVICHLACLVMWHAVSNVSSTQLEHSEHTVESRVEKAGPQTWCHRPLWHHTKMIFLMFQLTQIMIILIQAGETISIL